MTEEERFKITSNDYIDFMVAYNQNMRVFDRYPNASIHIMNDRNAVVYLPVAQLTGRSISQYGYSLLPSCYGLNSQKSIEASGIQRLRRLPNFNLRGQGVLVGIIDTGIEYTNPVFRNKDGTSRIAAIWDQTIDSENYPLPFFYGTQYLKENINQALASANPLEVVPSVDTNGHGTMLAGIAAGSEVSESNFSGIVPEAELIIVKLKQAKSVLRDFFIIPQDADCYQENDIMWAVQYIIDTSRQLQRPVAICIGLGTSQGAHDGRDFLSSLINIVADFPGVVITVAGGNEGNAARHFYSEINSSIGYSSVELNIGDNEPGFTMELWGTAPNTYSVDILTPTGEYIPRISESLRVNREISFVFERTKISVDYQMVETLTGDQIILMRFREPTAGIWNFKVYTRGDLQGIFNIWLPVSGFVSDNTYFIQPDPYTTITSPGNSTAPITVTAYSPDNNTLYRRAGKGYSRTNEIKPEIAAPGVNIQAPTLQQGFTNITGTSAAAAHTAGVTAMILEWAIVRGNYPGVDSVEIKKFLIRGAQRNPRLVYPNRDWGYGILDIYNVYNILRPSLQISNIRKK
ncbi:MAG: S8 family peptidase [Herbinix sp.]|nr:S8 family peptidase [Herbinix sp.]